ncbi:MAG: hypothetical protein MI824_07655 [Hyphomicrobiales bacterium]|nr:hypothetical protein [Hyphomicrobiales bacterium]
MAKARLETATQDLKDGSDMHIGLIGGIGPAATDYYYRRLIAALAEAGRDLDLTIAHADSPTLLRHLAANDIAAQAAIFGRLTHRLKAAGR